MSGGMSARDRVLARRSSIAANRSKGLKTYKFKAGITKFRIVPLSSDKSLPFERKFGKTYLKGFDGKSFFGIMDRSITYDEPSDPIRELIFDAMRQAPDEETKKHYQSMLAGTRFVFNALILDDKDQSPTEPVLLEMSETAFDTILNQFMIWSEADPDYDLAALDTGHVFTVEKTGQGIDTRYSFQVTPQKMPLPEKILEKAIDLDAWIESQVEGLEAKALEFLGRVNGAVGITTTIPAGALSHHAPSNTNAAAVPPTQQTMSTAAVTSVVEDIEDAEIVEIAEQVAVDPVAAAVAAAAAAEPAPVAAPVAEAPAPAAAPAASVEEADLEAILAQLNNGG